MDTWTVTQARSKLGEVIHRASSAGPQTITRNGRPVAIILPLKEVEKKIKRKGTLVEFFAESPLVGSGIEIKRIKEQPRDLDL